MRLDRVDERSKTKPRRDPYWARLSHGRYIGFRKMSVGGSGTWLARRYDDGQGKYAHHPLGDFSEIGPKERYDAAKRAAEEWFEHMDRGGTARPGTVWAACEAYVEQVRAERGDQVANETKTRLRRLVKNCPIGRINLATLATHHVNGWRLAQLKAIRAAGRSDATFNRNATFLRAALNFAKRQRRVATDQAWSEELKPIEGAGTPRRLFLDLDQRRRLIAAASEMSRPFFTALALQPMRPGELARCQVEHLDLEHRILHLPGGKTGARDVPLSKEALEHFRTCAGSKRASAWLISRADGSQWKKEAWRDEIKEAAVRANLPTAIVAGTLRHSTITDLVVGGLDLFTVAKVAGTSIAMIEKTYGKLRSDRARDALQRLSLKSD